MITNGSLLYWSQLNTDDEDVDNYGGVGDNGFDDKNPETVIHSAL